MLLVFKLWEFKIAKNRKIYIQVGDIISSGMLTFATLLYTLNVVGLLHGLTVLCNTFKSLLVVSKYVHVQQAILLWK